MLNERKARSFAYDAGTDEARLELGDGPPVRRAKQTASLLLDAKGHLVGVDLGGGTMNRTVAMLGPHEAVDRTADAEVDVAIGTDGTTLEIRIVGAKALMATGVKNPYVS